MFTEYHHILATIIQKQWKKYIIHKKIWCMLKPNESLSIERRAKQIEVINDAFERIHATTTHFKTLVIVFMSDLFINKRYFVHYKKNNVYSVYDEHYNKVFMMNRQQIGNKLRKLNNIVSIKLEAIVTDNNFYGYPEIMQIKVF